MPKSLFLFLLLLSPLLSWAQLVVSDSSEHNSETPYILKPEIDSIKANEKFWYSDELLENEKVVSKDKKKEFDFKTTSWSLNGLGSFVQLLAWILLAVVLGLMIYFMLKNINFQTRNRKLERLPVESTMISKEDIFESNHLKEVELALSENDFKRAIRWYFIWLLKELDDNEFIIFESYKTNHEYLLELKVEDKVLDADMVKIKDCIKYYEYLWFGDFKIDSAGFAKIESTFKSLIY